MMQFHLYVGFLKMVFIKHISLKQFDRVIKPLQSSTTFSTEITMKNLAFKIFAWILYISQIEKYSFNSAHSYNRKTELTFLLMLWINGCTNCGNLPSVDFFWTRMWHDKNLSQNRSIIWSVWLNWWSVRLRSCCDLVKGSNLVLVT